ncbi:hypothetical protein C8Q70DRAFT_994741 [Cubamyces menziesii]|nr:hypothetical protein C8Q70DRAFT_994741 [Cubamyces menziesii]
MAVRLVPFSIHDFRSKRPMSPEVETITLPNGTPFIIPTGTVDVGVAASFVDANSGVIASVLGTETLLKLEGAHIPNSPTRKSALIRFILASVAFVEAEEAIGAATTQLTAIVTTINSAPVVKVSSIGGKNEITIATGTKAVATTVFGGKSFTVVPK